MKDPRGLYTAMEELEKEIRQQLMNEAEKQLQFPKSQQDGPNYHTVCRADEVANGEAYDVELLDLPLKAGRRARIKIIWPYAGQPSFSVAVMTA